MQSNCRRHFKGVIFVIENKRQILFENLAVELRIITVTSLFFFVRYPVLSKINATLTIKVTL